MRAPINLTGNKIGRWTVLGPSQRRLYWQCRCDCGYEKELAGRTLREGTARGCRSCGLKEAWKLRQPDLTGKTINHFTIISPVTDAKIRWNCMCSCGKMRSVPTKKLLSGRTQSCGCQARLLAIKQMTGVMGRLHPSWKGGRRLLPQGYVMLTNPKYPGMDGNGGMKPGPNTRIVYEHVVIMANHIGRPILKGETIHHINGVRDDNRIENLELWNKSHPSGQRVEDKVAWAKEILKQYELEALRELNPDGSPK